MLFFWILSAAFAQEYVRGPHGGFDKQVLEFRVELVMKSKQSFDVYLLDRDNKNPTIHNSLVLAGLHRKKQRTRIPCAPRPDHFECKLEGQDELKELDKISLSVQRNKSPLKRVWFKLPLDFEN